MSKDKKKSEAKKADGKKLDIKKAEGKKADGAKSALKSIASKKIGPQGRPDEVKQKVELTVVRVAGGGNAGGGKYFYSFSPDIVLSSVPCHIVYVLDDDSSDGLRIRAVVSSASDGQMDPAVISKDGLTATVCNHLTRPELINVAVVVADMDREGLLVKCDPQVLNVPEN